VHPKLNIRHTAACLVVAICTADTGHAATPEAWADYEKAVIAACINVSGLRNAKPAGRLVDFDDRLGISAIVIQGRHSQKHMNNARGRVLCVFDKKTQTAFVSEAKDLLR
jgi:hypothetical protein